MQIFVSEVKYRTGLSRLCANRNSIPKTKSPMNLDDDSRRQRVSKSDSKTDPPWGDWVTKEKTFLCFQQDQQLTDI